MALFRWYSKPYVIRSVCFSVIPVTARSGDDAINDAIASVVNAAIKLGVASCAGVTLLAVAVLAIVDWASLILFWIPCTSVF